MPLFRYDEIGGDLNQGDSDQRRVDVVGCPRPRPAESPCFNAFVPPASDARDPPPSSAASLPCVTRPYASDYDPDAAPIECISDTYECVVVVFVGGEVRAFLNCTQRTACPTFLV